MTPRKTAGIVAGAVAAAGLAVGAVAAVNDDDPIERVGSVDVGPDPSAPSTTSAPAAAPAQDAPTTTVTASSGGAASDDGSSTTAPSSGRNRQVVALDELAGTFLRDDDRDDAGDHDDHDDRDDYEVNGRDLDFGPDDWVRTAGPLADYDGDGTVEDFHIELEGLVGQDVTLLVRFDDDDDVDVYVINGHTYRDSATGSTPWETDQARTESQQAAVDAATAAVADAARVDDVDRNGDGSWDVEVIDEAGREHDVRVSATGDVIRVDVDDHGADDDRHDDDHDDRFDG